MQIVLTSKFLSSFVHNYIYNHPSDSSFKTANIHYLYMLNINADLFWKVPPS